MRPLFDQVAAALQHAQLYQTARHEIERRTRAEREQTISLCVQRVRNQILQMEFEQDWGNVLTALRGELDGLMDYLGGGLTLIDREAETYQSCNILPDGSVKLVDHDSLPASLKQALDLQVPVYRHNRAEMDALGEDINPQAHSLTVSALPGRHPHRQCHRGGRLRRAGHPHPVAVRPGHVRGPPAPRGDRPEPASSPTARRRRRRS